MFTCSCKRLKISNSHWHGIPLQFHGCVSLKLGAQYKISLPILESEWNPRLTRFVRMVQTQGRHSHSFDGAGHDGKSSVFCTHEQKTANFQFVRIGPIANSLFIWRKGIFNTVIHGGMITGLCMASFHPWVIPHVCNRVLSYASQSLRSSPGNCLCCGSWLLGTKLSLKAACWE